MAGGLTILLLLLCLFLQQTRARYIFTFYRNADLEIWVFSCFRMSEREEHDFIEEYMTWMKGSVVQFESFHVYNFGYERPLPLPSVALTPDSTMRFNLQTSGMQTPSRWSIVIIGEKYLGRLGEIMVLVDRIHEETQALPFAIFLQSEVEINISSPMRVTPALVGIL